MLGNVIALNDPVKMAEEIDDPQIGVGWGRQDAIIPVECGELYRQALPNANLRIIDNCGHSPALEKPPEFLAAVTEFLSGL